LNASIKIALDKQIVGSGDIKNINFASVVSDVDDFVTEQSINQSKDLFFPLNHNTKNNTHIYLAIAEGTTAK